MNASAIPAIPLATAPLVLGKSSNIFRDRFGRLSDDAWCDLLIRSIREPEIDGVHFPRFPAPEFQEHMHGHSQEVSLREAREFYSFVKSLPAAREILRSSASFLDFGTGWGRIARLFMRDFDFSNMYGFEPNLEYCLAARSVNPYMCFLHGNYSPDGSIPADRFDLVVGWSVFSHLSEDSTADWLDEMARVMRTDGCCVFTTWGRRYLDRLVKEQDKLVMGRDDDIFWYDRECLEGAGDIRRQRDKYNRGEFVWFTPFKSDFYGETFIHPDALTALLRERRLPFELIEFDRASLGQDAFTLRRTATPVIQSRVPTELLPVVSEEPKRTQIFPEKSESFCIHLWNHLRLEADGEAAVCCAYEGGRVSNGGVPMSLAHQSLADVWNSDSMRAIRRDMAEGRRIPGCRQCYADEARGGVSQRVRDNAAWESGWLNPEMKTIPELVNETARNDFRLDELPALIEIETGNLCNFKCRMCNGNASTRIAKDPVHHKWAGGGDPNADEGAERLRRPLSVTSLASELAQDTEGQIKRLYFIGGEPLLVREVRGLLEGLIAGGNSQEIELSFVSNGSVVPRWLSLAAKFRRMDFAVSIDGFGEHYDYIRYPGRWSELTKRLEQLKKIPNINLTVTSTIQINNALNITDLFRYLDSVGIPFSAYLLHWPRHLAATVLPPDARLVAASRLRGYADDGCRPEHRALILSLAAQFEAGGELIDPGLLREFMLFTNDLDASRGQSIHETDPELVERLEKAGFPWVDERVHAEFVAAE